MSVRAKFVCQATAKNDDGTGQVRLVPVIEGSEENERFYSLTPAGEIMLVTVNQSAFAQFGLGKEYYVDFSPAD